MLFCDTRYSTLILRSTYFNIIAFIDLIPDWIFVFCFVFTNTWFYSFTQSQIECWSSASLLQHLISFIHLLLDWILIFHLVITKLDFIHSPAPRLNFVLLLRLYEHLISFIHPVPDWILIFSFVITNTWFHSFTYFQINFWSSASLLRILDYIHSPDLRLNFDLLLHH